MFAGESASALEANAGLAFAMREKSSLCAPRTRATVGEEPRELDAGSVRIVPGLCEKNAHTPKVSGAVAGHAGVVKIGRVAVLSG